MDNKPQDIKYANEKDDGIVLKQVRIICISFFPTYIKIIYNAYSPMNNDYSIIETLVLPILRGYKLVIE